MCLAVCAQWAMWTWCDCHPHCHFSPKGLNPLAAAVTKLLQHFFRPQFTKLSQSLLHHWALPGYGKNLFASSSHSFHSSIFTAEKEETGIAQQTSRTGKPRHCPRNQSHGTSSHTNKAAATILLHYYHIIIRHIQLISKRETCFWKVQNSMYEKLIVKFAHEKCLYPVYMSITSCPFPSKFFIQLL